MSLSVVHTLAWRLVLVKKFIYFDWKGITLTFKKLHMHYTFADA